MRKSLRLTLAAVGLLLIALLIGPFLIPVPPLEDTVPPEQLADPDSQFATIEGLRIHYKTAGEGEPTLVLLHGFGASLFSWREVMEPLAEMGTIAAFDRPAFGLTERPLPGEWTGENPYSPEFQARLTVGMMEALGAEEAVLVGNSAGGTLAVLTALSYPQQVSALVLVDPAIYSGGGSPTWILPLLRTPQMRHLGSLIVRSIRRWGEDFAASAWHDPSRITPEVWAGYTKPLQAENWDRALWELTIASRSSNLSNRLDEITMPVLVITGDDDRIVPPEQSIRLADELPNAELVVIPNCGHLPHEECAEPFLEAVSAFLDRLP
ncbi:MAG: alpha/beta hydrolase [Anaerolineae bacterium]|jgi:pimeloyl-ACP methyl ester carboxylesterase